MGCSLVSRYTEGKYCLSTLNVSQKSSRYWLKNDWEEPSKRDLEKVWIPSKNFETWLLSREVSKEVPCIVEASYLPIDCTIICS